jgi:putative transposase
VQLALEWPAWGHRKIHALLAVDGFAASAATVRRALARRGLLQPAGYQRERRELAKARKAAFVAPPTRRNRVWQTDFSELETAGGGTWQMSGVVDYVAKLALCCPVTTTKTWRDAVGALEDARGAVEDLLGVPLLHDCTCPDTGELTPVIVVSDNGPCYRAAGFARYIASRPELSHVRTRHRSPGTNGVIERFYESLKYEHLYRHEIDDGPALDEHVARFLDVYNRRRPHEALGFDLPIDRYLAVPTNDQPITEQPNLQTT